MEISSRNHKNLKALLDSAKATGAFPVGLKARIVEREAKYIWDNPYFRKNGKMTEPQKKQVYDYLLEARSNAMNVLSEEDRLKWFDKFRGRANNYLAKQGYKPA